MKAAMKGGLSYLPVIQNSSNTKFFRQPNVQVREKRALQMADVAEWSVIFGQYSSPTSDLKPL